MFSNKGLLSKREQIEKMVALPTITFAAEEADRFIDYIVDQSVLKNTARIVRMNKETKEIRALGFGSGRFLFPGDTFSSSDYKKEFGHNKISLTSKKLRGCVVIYDDDLEDNIEGDAFADHIMRIVAAKIANELEEIFWIGDTGSRSGFANSDARSRFDGWRYILTNAQVAADAYYNDVSGAPVLITGLAETAWATGAAKSVGDIVIPSSGNENGRAYIALDAGTTHSSTEPTWPTALGTTVVDNAGASSITWRCHEYTCTLGGKIAVQDSSAPYNWEFKYGRMLELFPSIYKKVGLMNLRFLNSDLVSQNYIDSLSARSTVLGDNAILGSAPLQYGKVPIVDVPLMNVDLSAAGVAGGGAYTDSLLTPKGNLILGIQRNIKLESQREAADEATYWFFSMRMDNKIENVAACALAEKLVTS